MTELETKLPELVSELIATQSELLKAVQIWSAPIYIYPPTPSTPTTPYISPLPNTTTTY